jgi:hypothetical protein
VQLQSLELRKMATTTTTSGSVSMKDEGHERIEEVASAAPRSNKSSMSIMEIENASAPPDPETSSTAFDVRDMKRLGKKQEMRRNFHKFATLSFTCIISTTNSSCSEFKHIADDNSGDVGDPSHCE